MNKPTLSICIPNYNRPEMLAKNLEAIASEYQKGVEIVVVDDCSPNPVDEVIQDFKDKHPKIDLKFFKNKPNLGFDRNVLKVIRVASGKYCWLLSNDDKILPGSVKKLFETIKKYPKVSLISVNYQRFDHVAQKITAKKMVEGVKSQLFKDADEFFFLPTPQGYFKFLGTNTLTMSTDIFRRKWWLESARKVKPFIKHNFIHVFVLGGLIQTHPQIYYVSNPQVEYLSNNHRTWPNDIWKDYNSVLLDYFISVGFNPREVENIRKAQRVYESREQLTKNKLLAGSYKVLLLASKWLKKF